MDLVFDGNLTAVQTSPPRLIVNGLSDEDEDKLSRHGVSLRPTGCGRHPIKQVKIAFRYAGEPEPYSEYIASRWRFRVRTRRYQIVSEYDRNFGETIAGNSCTLISITPINPGG